MLMSRMHRVALIMASGVCLSSAIAAMDPEDAKPTPQPAAAPAAKPAAQPADRPPAPPTTPPTTQPGEPRRGPAGERPVNVEGSMKVMNRALRQLQKSLDPQAGDPVGSKEDHLKLVNEMQRGCVLAKGRPLPDGVLKGAKDEAQKAAFAASYRKDLIATLRLLVDAEEAINDGKTDVAKAKLAQVAKLRDASHKELNVDQHDDPFGR